MAHQSDSKSNNFMFGLIVIVALVILTIFGIWLVSQNNSEKDETATPSPTIIAVIDSIEESATPQPPATLPPTATPTPTPSPTPTPLPPIIVEDVINPETAARVQLQARWGRGTLNQVAWSSTANVLAAASSLGIYFYEAETPGNAQPLNEIKFRETNSWVNSVAFSPDGSLLAAGLVDGTIRIYLSPEWELAGELKGPQGHQGSVTSLAFAPDGQSLASGSDDERVLLWRKKDALSWSAQEIASGIGKVRSLAFSPDGTHLAFGSTSRRVYLWETSGGVPTTLGTHDATIQVVAFDADGDFLASGSSNAMLKVWDVEKRDASWEMEMDSAVTSVAYSPEGIYLVIGTQNGTIGLYDTEGKFLNDLQTGLEKEIFGRQTVVSLAFRNRGNYLIAASQDGLIHRFVIADKPRLLTSTPEDKRHSNAIYSLAYSTDGSMIATGAVDGIIRLHDAANGGMWKMLHDQEGAALSLAFSPDGKYLVSGCENGSAALWLLSAQTLTRNLEIQNETPWLPVSGLAFSPNGQFLASGMLGGKVSLLDIKNNRMLGIFQTNRVKSIAYSPDGKLLASGSLNGEVRLWKVETRGPLRQLTPSHLSKPVNSVAFSPDGALLASASDDRTVHIWEMTGFSSEHIFSDYTLPVSSLAFSPDSRILATGAQDGAIHLWQLDGKYVLLITLTGHTGRVTGLAFSPDGKLLASTSEDGTLRIWGISTP